MGRCEALVEGPQRSPALRAIALVGPGRVVGVKPGIQVRLELGQALGCQSRGTPRMPLRWRHHLSRWEAVAGPSAPAPEAPGIRVPTVRG